MFYRFKENIKKILETKKCATVCMFHNVSDDKNAKSMNISINKFMEYIQKNKGNFINIDTLLSSNSKQYCNKKVITFDDGLDNVYNVVYPYLTNLNIPFTVFITLDFINKKGYLTKEQIVEMSKNPLVTIGGHGKSHIELKNLEKEKLYEEINVSKKVIEDIISKEIKYFAYPYGQYDKLTIKQIKKVGYDCAFGVRQMHYNIYTKLLKYNLPRITIQ